MIWVAQWPYDWQQCCRRRDRQTDRQTDVCEAYHVHPSHSVSTILGLEHWFFKRVVPITEVSFKLSTDKLQLTKVVIPGVVVVTQYHVYKLNLRRRRKSDNSCLQMMLWTDNMTLCWQFGAVHYGMEYWPTIREYFIRSWGSSCK